MKHIKATISIGLAAASFLVTTAPAFAAVIDFESFNLGGQPFLDVSSPLLFNNVGGSGVNVSIMQGADLRVYDLFQFGHDPTATGQALIDWPFPNGANTVGTTILFDTPLSHFSLRAGDFGGDDDSPLIITAFDAANNVIGTSSTAWPAPQNPPFALLSINAPGIRRVVYSSGGTFSGSTFIDDITFTPVPEPSTLALFGLAISGLALLRRKTA